jgi:pimeloyl-ACP methyl ester carboxylesterase
VSADLRLAIDGRPVGLAVGRTGLTPDRPAVVFVHGSGGSRTSWQAQIDPLDRHFGTVALDLPGHGQTPGPLPSNPAQYGAFVVRALETLRPPRPPVLAGISLGGLVVMEAALARPDLVSGLVLIATAALIRVDPELPSLLSRDHEAGVGLFASRLFAPENAAKLERPSREILRGVPADVLLADLRAGDGWDLGGRLDRIAAPTLVICGREDRLVPPDSSRRLAEGIPGARLEVLAGAGHMVHLEKFKEVNRLILEFVRETGGWS